jgi:hypothetical protein
MKQILTFTGIVAAIIAIAITATGRSNNMGSAKSPYTDTAGFAQFQAWKAQQLSIATVPAQPYARHTVYHENTYRTASPQYTYATQRTYRKKGWSKAAKGAVIGAGSGALIGAVINKRAPAVGAIVGGIAGGGAGYAIGRSMDKKDGRY